MWLADTQVPGKHFESAHARTHTRMQAHTHIRTRTQNNTYTFANAVLEIGTILTLRYLIMRSHET